MAVTKIINKIDLSSGWLKTSLENMTSCYLIAVKGDNQEGDTYNPKDVHSIIFEIGIDSGVKDSPIVINRVNLDFTQLISPDNTLNGVATFQRLTGIPTDIYIKPIALTVGSQQVRTGNTNISININPVKLVG